MTIATGYLESTQMLETEALNAGGKLQKEELTKVCKGGEALKWFTK